MSMQESLGTCLVVLMCLGVVALPASVQAAYVITDNNAQVSVDPNSGAGMYGWEVVYLQQALFPPLSAAWDLPRWPGDCVDGEGK